MKAKVILRTIVEIEFDPRNPKWQHYVNSNHHGDTGVPDVEKQEESLVSIAKMSMRTGTPMSFKERFESTMTPTENIVVYEP